MELTTCNYEEVLTLRRKEGEALGSNRNGNVETAQGADTKEQRKRSGEIGKHLEVGNITLKARLDSLRGM